MVLPNHFSKTLDGFRDQVHLANKFYSDGLHSSADRIIRNLMALADHHEGWEQDKLYSVISRFKGINHD